MHHSNRNSFPLSWGLGLKVFFILVPIISFVSLLNHHLLFTSRISYAYQPGHRAHVISPDEPATIIRTANPDLRWRLTTETLGFQVTIPRAISGIEIRGKLQAGTQSFVNLVANGVKGSRPTTLIHSSFLNDLSWQRVTDGTATLWMRSKRATTEKKIVGTGQDQHEVDSTWEKDIRQYTSISEFRLDPPELQTIATVGYDRLALAQFSGIEQDKDTITLPQIFRGRHQFYVYATGSELKITFEKIDRNRKKDSDPMTIRVGRATDLSSRKQTWLTTIKVKDDGNVGSTGPQGTAQPVVITVPTPRPGAYHVEIDTSEDVLFTNLSSTAHRLSFSGRVFIAEGPAYGQKTFRPLTILTNGSQLDIAAAHEQGKQDLIIAEKKYTADTANVAAQARGLSGITSVQILKPDVKMSSDGFITIMPAQILPSAGTVSLDLNTTPNLDTVDYVFAEYQPQSGKGITFRQQYDWSELELKGRRFGFAIQSPGLEASNTTVALKELRATLIRGPFPWGKLWQKLGLQS